MNRRDFVWGAGSLVALAGIGSAARVLPADAELLRPPGAASGSPFIALCTRCDRCRSVCPTEAIAPARLEDGLIAVRTPKLNFRLGWCNFCGKCAEVCPTGALPDYQREAFEFAGLPGQEFNRTDQVIGCAEVHQERCIAWVGPSSCTICSQKCPYEAIQLDEYNRPLVDSTLCNGCGVCENLCPSSQLLSFKGGQTRGIEVAPTLDGGA